MRKKLLVSFSGGETSAYMAQWLWKNKQSEYEMIFVFANTGLENEQTLQFVEKCSKLFGFNVVWVEAVVNPLLGKGVKHKIVDFNSASRNGEPFEQVISKYGIPNAATPHCTRDLKQSPITSYARSIGWKQWHTAIGIRIDEIDRMNENRKAKRFVYPLIESVKMTKPKINFWWNQQPFRLELKGYQGNCITCWKKSEGKLTQIAKENINAFDFFISMEEKYGKFIPYARKKKLEARGAKVNFPIMFFRKHRSSTYFLSKAITFNEFVSDDSMNFSYQEDLDFEEDSGSCEVFTSCGQ